MSGDRRCNAANRVYSTGLAILHRRPITGGDRVMDVGMEGPSISFAPLTEAKQPVCLAFSEAKSGFSPALRAFDSQSKGLISRAASIAKFNGSKKTSLDLIAPSGLDLERLLVMGLGTADRYNELEWMSLGGRIRARLVAAKVTVADVLLEASVTGAVNGRQAACVAMGFLLRGYEFKKYKKKKKEDNEEETDSSEIKSVRFLCAQPEEAKAHFE